MNKKKAILIANNTDLSEVLLRGLHYKNIIIFENIDLKRKFYNYMKSKEGDFDSIVLDFKYRKLLNSQLVLDFLKGIHSLLVFIDHSSFAAITLIAIAREIDIDVSFVDLYKLNYKSGNLLKNDLIASFKSLFENKYLKNTYLTYKLEAGFGSNNFRNIPIIKKAYITNYISIEEFRNNNQYDKRFINIRPKIKSNRFLWIDTIISPNLTINNSLLVKKLIQNANYFSIKKHPNEELSDLAKNMLRNGSAYLDSDLPLELYSFDRNVKFISPLFSTLLDASNIVIPNKRISLVKLFLGNEAINKFKLNSYKNKIEFLDSLDYLSRLLEI